VQITSKDAAALTDEALNALIAEEAARERASRS